MRVWGNCSVLKTDKEFLSPPPQYPQRGPAWLAEPVLKIEKIIEEKIQQKDFCILSFFFDCLDCSQRALTRLASYTKFLSSV
jgi:hypothetical protein